MEKVMSKQSFCWNGPVSVFLQFSHNYGETSSKKKILCQCITDLEMTGYY